MSKDIDKDKNELDVLIQSIADSIIKRIGKRAPYLISVSRNLREDADIVIRSGNPVEIYVSHLFIINCINKKKPRLIHDRIERALDKSKDCHKVLSNYQIINYRESVALLQDAKRWVRSNNPDAYINRISTIFFKKSYTVTVTDSLTNLSVTVSGNSIKKIEEQAIRSLIHLVEADEEQEEVRQLVLKAREPNISARDKIPEEVTLSGAFKKDELTGEIKEDINNTIKMDYTYESPQTEDKIE